MEDDTQALHHQWELEQQEREAVDSNQLREHIRELNKQELVQHELRRQAAIQRIRQLREEQKKKQHQPQ